MLVASPVVQGTDQTHIEDGPYYQGSKPELEMCGAESHGGGSCPHAELTMQLVKETWRSRGWAWLKNAQETDHTLRNRRRPVQAARLQRSRLAALHPPCARDGPFASQLLDDASRSKLLACWKPSAGHRLGQGSASGGINGAAEPFISLSQSGICRTMMSTMFISGATALPRN